VGPVSAVLGVVRAGLVARGVIRHARTQAPLLPLTGTEARTVVERVAAAGLVPVA
jgi:4-hydroxy-tetrahydrodipicolinate synthase